MYVLNVTFELDLEFIVKGNQTHTTALCFKSNVYEQRFLRLIKFLKKLSNKTSLF